MRHEGPVNRRRGGAGLRRLILVLAFGGILAVVGGGTALASYAVPQTWLPGQCIPQFQVALPVFGPGYNAALPRVNALQHPALTISMVQTSRQVLPDPFQATDPVNCPAVVPNPTQIFAYETRDSTTGQLLGPAFWPAVTVETRRFVPALVTYVNALPNGPGSVQSLVSVDQTIFWADPNGMATKNPCLDNPNRDGCNQPYQGPVPAVPHLHGGEVPSIFDGGPNAWFTPLGMKGPGYSSLLKVGAGKAVYLYPNAQEPGTPWFHDHALGATRTNVYSGLAAFYFIRDPANEPNNLPDGAYEVEMAIQDRQFDTNGQLYFPDGSGDPASNLNGTPPNPDVHPLWIPEFAGDVVVVNGSPWPYFNVEPRRYRFRIVGGANARMWNLSFGKAPVYVIGSDDAYLDAPARVNTLFIAPGERADIIVDFTKFAGRNITVTNDAPVPFPDGLWPVDHVDQETHKKVAADQPWMANIMQFRVTEPLRGRDTSCDPAHGGCTRPSQMIRLADGQGNVAAGVTFANVRQLILKEQAGFDAGGNETGPLQVLVNNTQFYGLGSASIANEFPVDGISELPRVGSTELWEIINLTADAHPMHTHLVQFQILNRQPFNLDPFTGYPAAWAAAFAGKCTPSVDFFNPCPGFGPPNSYLTPNADGALGGNPALSPYLTVGGARPPEAFESGWKDTAKSYPGEVLRMLVRWAPTSTPVALARPGLNWFPFDPTKGPGYVWHCHIVDHEDNEMMRPYVVTK
jgi:FtsP/CotA-like multicopper oxidase with cupredoxin domain